MGPSGFVALTAGWITTETGRQPYTVYGLLRTADSVSPIAAPAVGASLVAFVVVYFVVFGAGIWYMFRLLAQPPQPHERRRAETRRSAPPASRPRRLRCRASQRPRSECHAHRPADDLGLLIAFAVFVYVMLDGFDLGIGILFPCSQARATAMTVNTVAPVWDGNETWLVLGGGGLLAAFPLAYAVVLPALYMPIIVDAARR